MVWILSQSGLGFGTKVAIFSPLIKKKYSWINFRIIEESKSFNQNLE